eukprot:767114-Prorocentrum_minimum.AAC.1
MDGALGHDNRGVTSRSMPLDSLVWESKGGGKSPVGTLHRKSLTSTVLGSGRETEDLMGSKHKKNRRRTGQYTGSFSVHGSNQGKVLQYARIRKRNRGPDGVQA